jgi:2,5-diketo-D-gluconate reductase A
MTHLKQIQIADGVTMPQLGFGVFKVSNDQAAEAVATAIASGYRSIDTAAIYRNEQGTGEGLRRGNVPRGDIFVTSKLWNDRQGDASGALAESLEKLGLDYLDLYLIHWPAPRQNQFVEAWQALSKLRGAGLARAIGVSNFTEDHLGLVMQSGPVPAVNQIELHPYLQQPALRAFHAAHGITTEAWSPLGQGKDVLEDKTFVGLGEKHGKTVAQIVLRWHLQLGNVVIPKSVTPSRIRENIDVYDFDLDGSDMSAIAGLDRAQRLGPDPAQFG